MMLVLMCCHLFKKITLKSSRELKAKIINITEFKKDDKYIVFSGIGNHKTFVSMIQNYKLTILKDIEFPDHYKYNKKDINKILDYANQLNCKIITTEKDFLRLTKKQQKDINFLKVKLKITNISKLKKFLKSSI